MDISLGYCLYKLIAGPVEVLFSIVFSIALAHTNCVWASVLIISLVVNLVTMPLYNIAEAKQREQRAKDDEIQPGLKHIKDNFSGNERIMMQQKYLKKCGQGYFSSLNALLPVLFQVPFFMAAYVFLSELPLLNSSGFLGISDLGSPDGLIRLGDLSINVLPILMVVVNLLSSLVYTRKDPLKNKLQMLGLAAVFFVLLYNSPSGLLIYWVANNLFSLVRNLIGALIEKCNIKGISRPKNDDEKRSDSKSLTLVYVLMMVFMSLFIGLLLPSTLVNSAAIEFIDLKDMFNPALYVYSAFLLSAGTFLLWGTLIYYVARDYRAKLFIAAFVYMLVAVFNYFVYGNDAGNISRVLIYDEDFFMADERHIKGMMICILFAVIVIGLYVFFGKKLSRSVMLKRLSKVFALILSAAIVTVGGISVKNISGINLVWAGYEKGIREGAIVSAETKEDIVLSRDKENVMVIMLDRMIGGYIPYIMQERPDLLEVYDGFTYYPNVISFGGRTVHGTPPIFGGYEYTPERMKERSGELMKDKHNQALLLMPLLFSQEGYDVYVYDMPYPNYSMAQDISLFRPYPEIHAGYISTECEDAVITVDATGGGKLADAFFAWAVDQTLPGLFQSMLYDNGSYMLTQRRFPYDGAVAGECLSEAGELPQMSGVGVERGMDYYYKLVNLKNMISVSDEQVSSPAYVVIDNELPHEPISVKEPEYVPVLIADNREYEEERNAAFEAASEGELRLKSYSGYPACVTAMVALGDVLEKMKSLGVYDNTRIIIVSDHGFDSGEFNKLILHYDGGEYDTEHSYPLLMVKEAYAEGFTFNEEFMTNGDVPVLAMEGIIDDMTNPFTGNPISNEDKFQKPQLVYDNANPWPKEDAYFFGGRGRWFSVSEDRRNIENWEFLGWQ